MFQKLKTNPGLFVMLILIASLTILVSIVYQNEKAMGAGEIRIDTVQQMPTPEIRTAIDSLPHYQYQLVMDSLQHITDTEKEKNKINPLGVLAALSVSTFVGYMPAFRQWYGWYGDNKSHMELDHFLVFSGYSLEEGVALFYSNGKNYLRKKDGSTTESNVGYLPDLKSILFPISDSTYTFGIVVMVVLLSIVGFTLLYAWLALPINVLVNISRGKMFVHSNIRDLFLIAFTLLGYALLQAIMPFITFLILKKSLPDGFYISLQDQLSANWKIGVIGIIVLIIAFAFKKGYKLQQEQDLTI